MKRDRLRQLLSKYIADTISDDELDELLDNIVNKDDDSELEQLLTAILEEIEVAGGVEVDTEGLYQRILNDPSFVNRKKTRRISKWWSYGAAAALLLTIGVWLVIWNSSLSGNRDIIAGVERTVTTAPTDRPLLRLADGRSIDLDRMPDGVLVVENGVEIKLQGDALYYHAEPTVANNEVSTNTIVIPKGRQYQITLPDGSGVWLNAASEITYPIRFENDHREVKVQGEAYFEVRHAADWPFIVNTSMQRIEVLGTHFNVSAYSDDAYTKTTLVEGRVRISSPGAAADDATLQGGSALLMPGQQAVSRMHLKQLTVHTVDPEDIISWKENLFVFSNEEISAVMKKVSRWYDVEVEYKDGMAGKRIGGSIPILDNVGEMMEALKATGLLHYEMKGGTIVIMK